nr:hypothetical protein B0A51_15675 [Rachicladosporium sp. CCFEE 5018]
MMPPSPSIGDPGQGTSQSTRDAESTPIIQQVDTLQKLTVAETKPSTEGFMQRYVVDEDFSDLDEEETAAYRAKHPKRAPAEGVSETEGSTRPYIVDSSPSATVAANSNTTEAAKDASSSHTPMDIDSGDVHDTAQSEKQARLARLALGMDGSGDPYDLPRQSPAERRVERKQPPSALSFDGGDDADEAQVNDETADQAQVDEGDTCDGQVNDGAVGDDGRPEPEIPMQPVKLKVAQVEQRVREAGLSVSSTINTSGWNCDKMRDLYIRLMQESVGQAIKQ